MKEESRCFFRIPRQSFEDGISTWVHSSPTVLLPLVVFKPFHLFMQLGSLRPFGPSGPKRWLCPSWIRSLRPQDSHLNFTSRCIRVSTALYMLDCYLAICSAIWGTMFHTVCIICLFDSYVCLFVAFVCSFHCFSFLCLLHELHAELPWVALNYIDPVVATQSFVASQASQKLLPTGSIEVNLIHWIIS